MCVLTILMFKQLVHVPTKFSLHIAIIKMFAFEIIHNYNNKKTEFRILYSAK